MVKRLKTERVAHSIAVTAAIAAAIGTLIAGSEPEVTLLMVSAVIAGLVCFDAAMNRSLHALGPWLLLSLGPLLKTVPTVWYDLRSETDALPERYGHAGSLLFGLCVFGAVVLLSRPAKSLGVETGLFDGAVIVGSMLTAALAGASVAFLFDSGFGSTTAGRLIETPTWAVIGGLLAASVLAATRARALSASLTGVLVVAAATAGVLAYSVAGRAFDRGWWAVLFAGLAVSAVGFGPGVLGSRSGRDRQSVAGIAVVIVAGVVAAASAISARSDRTSWGPGWVLLGILSLALFALAMASRPLETPVRSREAERDDAHDIGVGEISPEQVAPDSSTLDLVATAARDQGIVAATAVVAELAEQAAIERAETEVAGQPMADVTTESGGLSDAGIVAAAQAAAAVRTAPSNQRHSLAPLAQAHHFDPSTGLLSAAGLQHAIGRAFDTHRHAGHVTIMLFTIRDLDTIEANYGRLASAAVTREVAERVQTLLPTGTGARFARSAYAIIFVGNLGEPQQTIERLARVLLQLRAPIEGGSLGSKIDVVGSMAQCYEGENAASFVVRANQGLARAVQNPDPTFVAMP